MKPAPDGATLETYPLKFIIYALWLSPYLRVCVINLLHGVTQSPHGEAQSGQRQIN